jgi:hypothetical protein
MFSFGTNISRPSSPELESPELGSLELGSPELGPSELGPPEWLSGPLSYPLFPSGQPPPTAVLSMRSSTKAANKLEL